MNTVKRAKWHKDSVSFLENAPCDSVELDVIISYGCHSQSGEGFEELVNLLNSDFTKSKVKKIRILDTSYLYRHGMPEFAKYEDSSIPTEWYLKNKDAIDSIEIDCTLRSWADEIDCDEFREWEKRVYDIFDGNDEKGISVDLKFRDQVISEAVLASHKTGKSFESCVTFMLEECAHTCAVFEKNTNLVYPMKVSRPVAYLAERYNIQINHLRYRSSVQTHGSEAASLTGLDAIDREVALFMKEKVTNVNFFVMDKDGNHIYKNYAYGSLVGDVNFGRLDPTSWETSQNVMRTRRQVIVEESYQDRNYLAVKSPLIVNGSVEGVIGLAVDITEKKRNEDLELKNHLQAIQISEQNRLSEVAEQVAHDIRSPLATLSAIVATLNEIPEGKRSTLRTAVISINNIANDLLSKYKRHKDGEDGRPFSVELAIDDVISQKTYQYKDLDVNFSLDCIDKLSFIRGNRSNFMRMLSNLINNSVEAVRDNNGEVSVSVRKKGQCVEIVVSDNGFGMNDQMIADMNNDVDVGSTKVNGYGVGLSQVKNTVRKFGGAVSVSSQLGNGTQTKIVVPSVDIPTYVVRNIVLHNDSVVIVLDDEPSVHEVWKDRLSNLGLEKVVCCLTADEVRSIVSTINNKKKILFLSDYELRCPDVNGLSLINELGLVSNSILVTNGYSEPGLQDAAKTLGVKILPKVLANEIPISFAVESQKIVIVDDNVSMAESLALFLENEENVSVDVYTAPAELLENIAKYDKQTKFVIDHDFRGGMTGVELAGILNHRNYGKLFLLSGSNFSSHIVPEYLTVLVKGNVSDLHSVLMAA